MQVKLNGAARALLKRFGKLPITVTVTQAITGSKPRTISTRRFKVKPAHKHR